MRPKIVMRFGDADPIEHGGGVVWYAGDYWIIQFTYGIEHDAEAKGIPASEHKPDKLIVYTVYINPVESLSDQLNLSECEPNLLFDNFGKKTKSSVKKLACLNMAKSIKIIEKIGTLFGWDSLNKHPALVRVSELDESWFGEEKE